MKLVLIGPPGSGKGTQAKYLSENLGIPHISSGDILRSEVRAMTEFGMKIKEFMNRGEIGPAELITEVVLHYISANCPSGFILDGFPRTLYQAEKLEEVYSIVAAILLEVPDEVIVSRITGRRICGSCGKIYHLAANPPRAEGTCDGCGKALHQRDDDNEATVRNRISVYATETMPVIDYYRQKGILHRIDGRGEADDIFGEIMQIV